MVQAWSWAPRTASACEVAVLLWIAWNADRNTGEVKVSGRVIGEALGVDRRSVDRALASLAKLGAIEVVVPGRGSGLGVVRFIEGHGAPLAGHGAPQTPEGVGHGAPLEGQECRFEGHGAPSLKKERKKNARVQARARHAREEPPPDPLEALAERIRSGGFVSGYEMTSTKRMVLLSRRLVTEDQLRSAGV